MRFENKVVAITGAGSGIGRGLAEFFAKEGALVVIDDINEAGIEAACLAIRNGGGQAVGVLADISTEAGAASMIETAIANGGKLDLLVNNAGRQAYRNMDALGPEDWDLILAVNLKAYYLCSKAAATHLAQQRGAIVNIASVHAYRTIEGFTAYAASKAGILGLNRAMAIELAPSGVRVNAVSPGTIDTPLLQAYFDSHGDAEAARRDFMRFHPVGRFGSPNDVGEAVAFLGSSQAGFITGTELVVDGGMLACLIRN